MGTSTSKIEELLSTIDSILDDSYITCQVADPSKVLYCNARDSGGIRCEVEGEHTDHWVSWHTIRHSLAGNGYSCSSFSNERITNDED